MKEAPRQRISPFAKVYAGFGAALAILAVMTLISIFTSRQLNEGIGWQQHTDDVLRRVQAVMTGLRSVEAAHRGFVAVGDPHFLREYDAARDSVLRSLHDVDELTADNAVQQARLSTLEGDVQQRLANLDSTNALRQSGALAAATDAMRRGSQSQSRNRINAALVAVAEEEQRLLEQRQLRVRTIMRRGNWINAGGVAATALIVLISAVLVRNESRRRRRTRAALTASEERLRDFLDSASDLIQSSGPDGRLLYVNRALLDTLGYSASEVIGQPSSMFFAPEERAHGDELFEQIMSGQTVTGIDTVYVRKDGRRVHVAGSSNCRFEDGRPVASRTILHDVTREREVEHMKDEFVSIVSHELRTPLTSIRGALGLLAGGMLGEIPDRGRRMLDVAITNTDRLVRLINDILDVERIESGEVPMARRRVRLQEIMKHVEDLMRPFAEKAGVRLEISCVDVDLDADADRIIQTLTNLVSNSVKFSPSETTVRVVAEREMEYVHIRVSDEGRGIPADKLEMIFERFQQVDASDAREKGGSGLGLAISRGIVEQHGGRIWAASELNAGATLHILLPIMAAPKKRLDLVPSETNAQAPLVLICDDDEDVITVLSEVLTERGYRVMATADGPTAVELAATHKPAVVLLDLLIPGVFGGWRTTAALKERAETRDIPVIIMSGSDVPPVGSQSIRKPLDSGALVRAIEHALTQWGAGASVLVVEDDEDLARILLEFLRSHGLRPVHASDGREAVRLSQQVQPSLIILDLMLPDTDGFAVVDWLRQHDRLREVPIMVYTARDLDEDQRRRLGVAPEYLFTKSRMKPEDLVDRVVAMVGHVTSTEEKGES